MNYTRLQVLGNGWTRFVWTEHELEIGCQYGLQDLAGWEGLGVAISYVNTATIQTTSTYPLRADRRERVEESSYGKIFYYWPFDKWQVAGILPNGIDYLELVRKEHAAEYLRLRYTAAFFVRAEL